MSSRRSTNTGTTEAVGALVGWYATNQRELPWRLNRDPWRVLVSEVMLVQTTVETVRRRYEDFLTLFPSPRHLAEASPERVIKAWEGLGYYRRARLLQAAAAAIVERHRGSLPADHDALLALPGVGRYIAGAVAAIAFDLPQAILEANSERFLARWAGETRSLSEKSVKEALWQRSGEWVSAVARPSVTVQALMEIGALICKPADPRCDECPVRRSCRARKMGAQAVIPRKDKRQQAEDVTLRCAMIETKGKMLVVRRADDVLWAGLWELPTLHRSGANPGAHPRQLRWVEKTTLRRMEALPPGPFKAAVTRYKLQAECRRESTTSCAALKLNPIWVEQRWVDRQELHELAMTALGRRARQWLMNNAKGVD